jgi:hypothetical protein
MKHRSFITTAAVAASLLLSGAAAGEIYKIVDADGNVIYTDQPPSDGAQPMELPGLSIVESVRKEPKAARRPAASEDPEVTSIRDLRRGYRDFAIVSPAPEETLWGTDNSVVVTWDTQYQLQPDMKVTFYVDGEPRATTTEASIKVEQLDRGEHRVHAELWDARNRKIATAEPVTFYIQQYSVNYGNNRNSGN